MPALPTSSQAVHVFNLRGTSGRAATVSRQEGGKIFGSGARTPVAITLLVKNPAKKPAGARFVITTSATISTGGKASNHQASRVSGIETAKKWTTLAPNDDHDWINQRDPAFEKFMPIGDKKNGLTVFSRSTRGG